MGISIVFKKSPFPTTPAIGTYTYARITHPRARAHIRANARVPNVVACSDEMHATMHARAERPLSRASKRAVPKRCYRYRAPGCRARSFHSVGAPCTRTHTHARVRTHVCARTREYPRVGCRRHRYIPAPGTNIIACRDKFIADVPQPFANVPRLRRKTGARKGRRRRAEGTRSGGEKGREGGRDPRVDLWTFRGIYPAAGITRYTRCPRDNSASVSNIMRAGSTSPRNREKLSRGSVARKMRATCEFVPLKDEIISRAVIPPFTIACRPVSAASRRLLAREINPSRVFILISLPVARNPRRHFRYQSILIQRALGTGNTLPRLRNFS